jgi:hypothetical protein
MKVNLFTLWCKIYGRSFLPIEITPVLTQVLPDGYNELTWCCTFLDIPGLHVILRLTQTALILFIGLLLESYFMFLMKENNQ